MLTAIQLISYWIYLLLVGEANSLFAFVQEQKKIIAIEKNLVRSVKLANI